MCSDDMYRLKLAIAITSFVFQFDSDHDCFYKVGVGTAFRQLMKQHNFCINKLREMFCVKDCISFLSSLKILFVVELNILTTILSKWLFSWILRLWIGLSVCVPEVVIVKQEWGGG